MKLELVSTDDLIKELVARTGDFAVVYIRIEEGNKEMLTTEWDMKSSWHALVGMVEALKEDIQEAHGRRKWPK